MVKAERWWIIQVLPWFPTCVRVPKESPKITFFFPAWFVSQLRNKARKTVGGGYIEDVVYICEQMNFLYWTSFTATWTPVASYPGPALSQPTLVMPPKRKTGRAEKTTLVCSLRIFFINQITLSSLSRGRDRPGVNRNRAPSFWKNYQKWRVSVPPKYNSGSSPLHTQKLLAKLLSRKHDKMCSLMWKHAWVCMCVEGTCKYVHMSICVHCEFAYEHVCVNMYPWMNMCANVVCPCVHVHV